MPLSNLAPTITLQVGNTITMDSLISLCVCHMPWFNFHVLNKNKMSRDIDECVRKVCRHQWIVAFGIQEHLRARTNEFTKTEKEVSTWLMLSRPTNSSIGCTVLHWFEVKMWQHWCYTALSSLSGCYHVGPMVKNNLVARILKACMFLKNPLKFTNFPFLVHRKHSSEWCMTTWITSLPEMKYSEESVIPNHLTFAPHPSSFLLLLAVVRYRSL